MPAFKEVPDTLSPMFGSRRGWTFGGLRLTRHIDGRAVSQGPIRRASLVEHESKRIKGGEL